MAEDFLMAKIDKTERRVHEIVKEIDELTGPLTKNEAVIPYAPDWAQRRLERADELSREAKRLTAEMRRLNEEWYELRTCQARDDL